MAAMALISLPKLRAALSRHGSIVIDGLYSFSEYKLLVNKLGAPLVLIAIAAPRHLRYQRLATRAERPLTAREASDRDIQEIEKLEKGGPIAIADYTLINDDTPVTLLAQLDALLGSLAIAT